MANAVSWLPASVAGSTTRRFAFSTTNWPAEADANAVAHDRSARRSETRLEGVIAREE